MDAAPVTDVVSEWESDLVVDAATAVDVVTAEAVE